MHVLHYQSLISQNNSLEKVTHRLSYSETSHSLPHQHSYENIEEMKGVWHFFFSIIMGIFLPLAGLILFCIVTFLYMSVFKDKPGAKIFKKLIALTLVFFMLFIIAKFC